MKQAAWHRAQATTQRRCEPSRRTASRRNQLQDGADQQRNRADQSGGDLAHAQGQHEGGQIGLAHADHQAEGNAVAQDRSQIAPRALALLAAAARCESASVSCHTGASASAGGGAVAGFRFGDWQAHGTRSGRLRGLTHYNVRPRSRVQASFSLLPHRGLFDTAAGQRVRGAHRSEVESAAKRSVFC